MVQASIRPADPQPEDDVQHQLISSRRVEGTPVFNPDGKRLGAVHSVMIEKQSGRVPYAVLSFGGFLGMREHVHPVPWDMLRYDVDLDGYVIDMSREDLEAAPTMRLDDTDRPRRKDLEEMEGYYGKMPWWGL